MSTYTMSIVAHHSDGTEEVVVQNVSLALAGDAMYTACTSPEAKAGTTIRVVACDDSGHAWFRWEREEGIVEPSSGDLFGTLKLGVAELQ